MDRELVFAVLCAWVLAPLLALGAFVANRSRAPLPADERVAGSTLEAEAGWRLLAPLLPAGLGLVGLVGWALREPDHAEVPPWPMLALSALPWLLWGRAFARAARAFWHPVAGPAATVGFYRRRIVVSPAFAATLDEAAHEAMMAHERAHARHHDPLRLWLAQLSTDLQWPLPGARARLDAYCNAVELARDDEARLEVDGADLATAVLKAARSGHGLEPATAGIASKGSALKRRIERLLAPVPPALPAPQLQPKSFALAFAAALALSLGCGLHFGEAVISRAFGLQF